MSTATFNKESRSLPHWPPLHHNGIVRSFVASRREYLLVKRAFDIFFSATVILFLLSWLVPLLALVIRAGSGGPVFFRQNRIGKNGRPFNCIKFRTMVVNPEADYQPAATDDARITRVGRFLRNTNIDELPQFFNVLLGQMSVVGPRPHMVADCVRFSFVVHPYQFRNLVKPGITGLAQVNGCHGYTADYDSIILRYYWDAQYVRKARLWIDLKIIAATIRQGARNLWKAISRRDKRK